MAIKAYSYIRFSTPEQSKGDSLRRQVEKSQEYADKHGLVLDDTLNLRDLGVSAFRRANVEKGNLGAFLKAIEKGLVEPGSYLIIESLDRLSRADVLFALGIFINILDAGIVIVTLLDERKYSIESVTENNNELLISIAVMMRSHEESLVKSKRRKASWENAKKLAKESGKKITRKIPFWLSLSDIDGDFQIKPEAVDAVRLIFDLARTGLGYLRISQELNKRGILSPGARNYKKPNRIDRGWGTSSIAHVLSSEAVIGNLVIESRTGAPEVVKGYYPPIIDESVFFEIRAKGPGKRGRSSLLKTNLFTRLLRCGYCGKSMQVDAGMKDGVRRSNMMCQHGRRGFACSATAWHYEDFEETFFLFVREVDVGELVGRKNGDRRLEKVVNDLRGRLASNAQRKANLLAFVEESYDKEKPDPSIKRRLFELDLERRDLEEKLAESSQELDDYLHSESRINAGVAKIRELYSQMKAQEGEERVMLRYSIAEYIASIIEYIEIYSHGISIPMVDVRTDEPYESKSPRSFSVKFRSGMRRLVVPDANWSFCFDRGRPDRQIEK